MSQPTIHIVPFYEDEVRSYCTPDGRQFVILRDPFLRLGLNADRQIDRIKRNPLYKGFLERVEVVVSGGMGLQRTVKLDALNLEMMPMCLAQLNLRRINEANRPKLLRYQRECAKVLARHWSQRDLIDAYLLPGFRRYEEVIHKPPLRGYRHIASDVR